MLTLVNLEDVCMEVYLPSADAAGAKIGTDSRITVVYAPGRTVAGYVKLDQSTAWPAWLQNLVAAKPGA